MKLCCKHVVLASQMQENADFYYSNRLQCRDQLQAMKNFSQSDSLRVGVLYGLRRTGKTVLLKQWLQSLPYEERTKAAYISVDAETMSDVKADLRTLRENGYKYVALDEITTCEDFIDRSAPLSDDFARSGMKLFIAGTDSLSVWFALNDTLFDRDTTLHTTHIPFAEWSRLTQQSSLDEYIRWGGLLHLQPTPGEIRHAAPLPWTANDARDYFTSSISRNIQNSVRRYDEGIHAGLLEPLLEDPALCSAIYGLFGNVTRHEFISTLDVLAQMSDAERHAALQSSVSHDTHAFSSTVMAKQFRPPDLSRTVKIFGHRNERVYRILSDIATSLRGDAEKLLEIRTKNGSVINDAQFIELENYLRRLEVLAMRPGKAFLPLHSSRDDAIQYKTFNDMLAAQNIVVQPGLRYAQADIVLSLLEQDPDFEKFDESTQEEIKSVYIHGVYGIMQEDIILYETMQKCKEYGSMKPWDNYTVDYASLPIIAYKAMFPRCKYDSKDKEIDMVIKDKESGKYYLVEIKHAEERHEQQSAWLRDDNVLNRLVHDRKKIASKTVLYRGDTRYEKGIAYVNTEEYLTVLHENGITRAMALLSDKTAC